MKQVNNMAELFERLNDLKSIFKYGQKLIPIIQSIINFMGDTVPLLEDINHSIADSTAKIPKAKDQINNISSATELATTEILDIVDSISADIELIESKVTEFQKEEAEKHNVWNEIKKMLPDNAETKQLIAKYESNTKFESESSGLINSFNKIKDDVYNISLSLQVQDITSQQLAAVNHLIESVQQSLASLIFNLDESDVESFNEVMKKEVTGKAFDADARYEKDSNRQDSVDQIINNELNRTSQDEIDKLFS